MTAVCRALSACFVAGQVLSLQPIPNPDTPGFWMRSRDEKKELCI